MVRKCQGLQVGAAESQGGLNLVEGSRSLGPGWAPLGGAQQAARVRWRGNGSITEAQAFSHDRTWGRGGALPGAHLFPIKWAKHATAKMLKVSLLLSSGSRGNRHRKSKRASECHCAHASVQSSGVKCHREMGQSNEPRSGVCLVQNSAGTAPSATRPPLRRP